MAEYVEREALRNALYEADAITMEGVKIINQFSVADVAPVRHGQWKIKLYHGIAYQCCPECGQRNALELGFKYCPNCGARMDGGADNA